MFTNVFKLKLKNQKKSKAKLKIKIKKRLCNVFLLLTFFYLQQVKITQITFFLTPPILATC